MKEAALWPFAVSVCPGEVFVMCVWAIWAKGDKHDQPRGGTNASSLAGAAHVKVTQRGAPGLGGHCMHVRETQRERSSSP